MKFEDVSVLLKELIKEYRLNKVDSHTYIKLIANKILNSSVDEKEIVIDFLLNELEYNQNSLQETSIFLLKEVNKENKSIIIQNIILKIFSQANEYDKCNLISLIFKNDFSDSVEDLVEDFFNARIEKKMYSEKLFYLLLEYMLIKPKLAIKYLLRYSLEVIVEDIKVSNRNGKLKYLVNFLNERNKESLQLFKDTLASNSDSNSKLLIQQISGML